MSCTFPRNSGKDLRAKRAGQISSQFVARFLAVILRGKQAELLRFRTSIILADEIGEISRLYKSCMVSPRSGSSLGSQARAIC